MTPDVLIVGSGLAGLSLGALMARSGRRVRILEAHEHVGGFAHTFVMGGKYRFNAQLHYVWNCGSGETVHRFLDRVGLVDDITFERYDGDGYDRMRLPGYALDICGDRDELVRRLTELFPGQQASFAAFLDDVLGTEDDMIHWPPSLGALFDRPLPTRLLRYRRATLQDVFDRHRLPSTAQALLALQWPDFLLPPAQLSFLAWVKLFTGYMRGAYYPTRHYESVVDALVKVVEDNGGEVLTGHRVVRFIRDGHTIRGVASEATAYDGADHDEITEHLAGRVVCNMDPRRAAEMIGLEHFSKALRRRLDYAYSPSNFVAYLVVEGIDLRDHGFGRSNLFHSEDADLNATFESMYERGDYRRPSFAMTVPTLLTDAVRDCPDGHHVIELLTVADYERFKELKFSDARAYQRKKKEILDVLLDIIERDYVPGIRDRLVFHATGSPTTNERYCRAPRGNSYGSTMTPANIGPGRLDHRTSLDRFYFCNASSGFAGFAGTVWTGCRLYEHLTGDRVLS